MRVSLILLLTALSIFVTQCRSGPNGLSGKQLGPSQTSDDLAAQMTTHFSIQGEIPGEYLKAFISAYEAFTRDTDIKDYKKNIENYKIVFERYNKVYKITFYANRKPYEQGNLEGGGSELGTDVTYTVSRKTYQLVSKQFYK